MLIKDASLYRCPKTGVPLRLVDQEYTIDKVMTGTLTNSDGLCYPIADGLPNFTYPQSLLEKDQLSRNGYDSIAKNYDEVQRVTFSILSRDESVFRQDMVDLLHIKSGDTILETAAGTGLNLPFIKKKMGGQGQIFVQDISPGMLNYCQPGLDAGESSERFSIHRSLGNAAYLPFSDNFFDAALSFGGIGVFSDQSRAIEEMVRVVKPGGRIVFGDEGVAPWLREADYGRILIDNNPFYKNEAPIHCLPVDVRDVSVRWVLGGGFYLVDLTVGEGEPQANFNFPIPGARGGTLNSRYFGKLEGVTPETKKMVEQVCKRSSKSLHQWLDDALRTVAEKEIKG